MVVLRWSRPLGGALKNGHFFCLSGNGSQKLHGTGTGAYHGDILALEVDIMAPVRRMPPLALESIQSRDRGDHGDVQIAGG